jgi:hypothetical protein
MIADAALKILRVKMESRRGGGMLSAFAGNPQLPPSIFKLPNDERQVAALEEKNFLPAGFAVRTERRCRGSKLGGGE